MAADSAPPVFNVDLRAERTLKPFFDAGLRPRQRLGFETSSCVLPRQTTLALDLGPVKLPPLKADWEIRIRHDERISEITGDLNRLLSLEEAKNLSMSLNEALGLPPADAVRNLEIHADPRKTGLPPPAAFRGIEPGGTKLSVSYHLTSSTIREKPYHLSIVIHWLKPREKFVFRDKPVHAPPGYEDYSMEPDRNALFKSRAQIFEEIQQISTERKVRITRETEALKAQYDEEGRRQAAYRSMLTWSLVGLAALGAGWLIWRGKKAKARAMHDDRSHA